VIADLEDAVPEAQKEAARETVARVFGAGARSCLRCVRIGTPGTEAAAADLRMLEPLDVDLVVVPKALPDGLRALPAVPPKLAIVETPAGLRAAHEVGGTPSVVALMLGTDDLSSALGLGARDDGQELLHAPSTLVVDCAAAGVAPPLDGPYLSRDLEGPRRQIALSRSIGFGGKACIHPAQITAVNDGFSYSAGQVEWARRVVDAFEDAEMAGHGAVALDGTMVDKPVAVRARAVLARTRGERR
jgi:citrate lyase beta subunit